jgi:hypothetical protein
MPPPLADWEKLKIEYIQHPRMTQKQLAEKYNIRYDTVRAQAMKGHWNTARIASAQRYAQEITAMAVGKDAVARIREIDEKQLKRNEEMRYIVDSTLKIRDAKGVITIRPNLTTSDAVKAVSAFIELYRCDRLALGASTENIQPAPMRDRFAEMSEAELFAELDRVRDEPMIQ